MAIDESSSSDDPGPDWLPVFERWWRSYVDQEMRAAHAAGGHHMTFVEYAERELGARAAWAAAAEWRLNPASFERHL